jgi:hypothetical protein
MDRTPIIKAIQSRNGWRNGYAHSEQKGAHSHRRGSVYCGP